MSALSIFQPFSSSAAANSVPSGSHWSAVKVQRVWRTALASIGLIAAAACGILALSSSLFYIVPAALLTVVSGGLLWSVAGSIDFENPDELASIRQKATNRSLSDLVASYGWEKLFRYEILSPETFKEKFQKDVEGLHWNDLAKRHEEAEKNLQETIRNAPSNHKTPFQIPPLSQWKDRFLTETKHLPLEQILASYRTAPLICHQILDDASIEIFKKGEEAKTHFERRRMEEEAEFVRKTTTQREVLNLKEEWIQQKYDRAALENELEEIHRGYLHNVETERKIAHIQQQAERLLLDHLKKSLSPFPTPEERSRLSAAQTACETRSSLIQESLNVKKNGLYQGYLLAKKAVEARIQSLRKLQEAELASVRLSYSAAIKPYREETDQKIALFRKELEEKLSDLSRQYEEIRTNS